ncbi:MAG: hypothetical protein P4L87_18550, partial [Formivibrio sp.]|nr:hypothetical protein [Formivibrio sp.]
MNRRELIKVTLLAAGSVGARGALPEAVCTNDGPQSFPVASSEMNGERMPNILWICTDQQRADTIGGFNNAHVKTPNLRKMMA